MRKVVNLTGRVFGRWTVLSFSHIKKRKKGQTLYFWFCKCSCDNKTIKAISSHSLRSKSSLSCGCLRKEKLKEVNTTHGKHNSPTYKSWHSMVQRCTNPNSYKYCYWGGRGITLYEKWKIFTNFLADMGGRPNKTSIGRINNDLGYFPGNCRWETREEQNNNSRHCHMIEHNGQCKNLTQWSKELGIKIRTIYYRISAGWDIKKVLTPINNI